MNHRIKIFLTFVFALLLFVSTESFSQSKAKKDSPKHKMEKMGCCKEKSESQKSLDCKKETDSPVSNEIKVDEVDKNKDGKVFIDGMCPDVVKDEPGNCPECGMKLKEVSLEDAKNFINKRNQPKHNH